jgi:hypothetical protein
VSVTVVVSKKRKSQVEKVTLRRAFDKLLHLDDLRKAAVLLKPADELGKDNSDGNAPFLFLGRSSAKDKDNALKVVTVARVNQVLNAVVVDDPQ